MHKKVQFWLDLDLCGSRPTRSKGTVCCQWLALSEEHFMQVPSVSLFNVMI